MARPAGEIERARREHDRARAVGGELRAAAVAGGVGSELELPVRGLAAAGVDDLAVGHAVADAGGGEAHAHRARIAHVAESGDDHAAGLDPHLAAERVVGAERHVAPGAPLLQDRGGGRLADRTAHDHVVNAGAEALGLERGRRIGHLHVHRDLVGDRPGAVLTDGEGGRGRERDGVAGKHEAAARRIRKTDRRCARDAIVDRREVGRPGEHERGTGGVGERGPVATGAPEVVGPGARPRLLRVGTIQRERGGREDDACDHHP